MSVEPFPVTRVAEVPCDLGRPRWLIEPLWAAAGVGVLGGQPKTCKTWMAIDIALSVASSTPCLDTFPVAYPGPVLLFLAEDSADSTYERISGICQHRCIDLDKLDLFLLTTPVLRLDSSTDYQRLVATVDSLRPRLLVLDPFVRVHSVDENSASEVSRLLADLTTLKRTYEEIPVKLYGALVISGLGVTPTSSSSSAATFSSLPASIVTRPHSIQSASSSPAAPNHILRSTLPTRLSQQQAPSARG
jgi:hypothetical protein